MRISNGNFHWWKKTKSLVCGVTHTGMLRRVNEGKPAVNQGCSSTGSYREIVENQSNKNHQKSISFFF